MRYGNYHGLDTHESVEGSECAPGGGGPRLIRREGGSKEPEVRGAYPDTQEARFPLGGAYGADHHTASCGILPERGHECLTTEHHQHHQEGQRDRCASEYEGEGRVAGLAQPDALCKPGNSGHVNRREEAERAAAALQQVHGHEGTQQQQLVCKWVEKATEVRYLPALPGKLAVHVVSCRSHHVEHEGKESPLP